MSHPRAKPVHLMTGQAVNSVWSNMGGEIDTQGADSIAVWMDVNINSAENMRIRAVGRREAGGDDFFLPIRTVSASDVKVEDEYIEFNVDEDQKMILEIETNRIIPFVQFQVMDSNLTAAMALANALKITNNAHAADALDHTTAIDNVNYPIVTANATDLTTLIALVTVLLTSYDAHDADAELGAAWVFHAAQEAADHSLASAAAPTTLEECVTRLNDLLVKYNAHDADTSAHGVGGAHQEATAAVVDATVGAYTSLKVVKG